MCSVELRKLLMLRISEQELRRNIDDRRTYDGPHRTSAYTDRRSMAKNRGAIQSQNSYIGTECTLHDFN